MQNRHFRQPPPSVAFHTIGLFPKLDPLPSAMFDVRILHMHFFVDDLPVLAYYI